MKLSIFYELNCINIHTPCQQKFSQKKKLQTFKHPLTSAYIYETLIQLTTSFDTFPNIAHAHRSLTSVTLYFHSPNVLHPLPLNTRFVLFLFPLSKVQYNPLKFVMNSIHLQNENSQFFLLVLKAVLNDIDH